MAAQKDIETKAVGGELTAIPALGSDTEDSGQEAEAAPASSRPPNGGLTAWMQVVACFFLYLNTLGLINTFGVFQTYYERTLLRGSSASAIAWIGSIQGFCFFAIGVVVGPAWDAGHCRSLLVAGTLLIAAGFMATSLSGAYWQILLAQGLCVGLGTSCLYIPSIALVPQYFDRDRRAWAMGLATMGSGTAATVFPVMFTALQPRIGFAWTVRVWGFLSLVTCGLAMAVARPRFQAPVRAPVPVPGSGSGPESEPEPKAASRSIRSIVKAARLTDPAYMVYVVAIFFNNLGFFEPLVYLQSYALDNGGAASPATPYLLAILNASSLFGRLVPSALAPRVGVVNAFIIVTFLSAASVFYWTSASTAAGNIAFAVLYGFFAGGVVAFAPVVLTNMTTDMGTLGTRLGALSVLKGVGSLAGTPIAGAILQGGGGYLGMQLFTGFSILLTVAFSLVLRGMMKAGKGRRE
ncbi:major facilitator superfamily domain-containing protein [Xylariaceae sp. FL0016]|nr:major facilitator superfamily domain-containing protein [Xylariaceae sp. FL0016]